MKIGNTLTICSSEHIHQSKGFNMKEVFIYDAVRTPRGKGRKEGRLHEVTALALSTTVLNNIRKRNDLDGHIVEDVIWGNVTQIGERGGKIGRQEPAGQARPREVFERERCFI